MAKKNDKLADIMLEDVRIMYRNFSGKAGQFNAEGQRNFCVIFDRDDLIEKAEEMILQGFNIKRLHPVDPEDTRQPYMQVKVNFNGQPPKIILITSKGKTQIGEDEVSLLDWAEIEVMDIIISPYEWEVGGRTGVTAYLKSAYITIHEDELEKKYYDGPDSAIDNI